MDEKPRRRKDYISLVPAVEQAGRVLLHLASVSGLRANLTEVSRGVGISASKALAILNTLQRLGFVSKDSEGKLYSLGQGLIPLGRKALENVSYRDMAKPILEQLARETSCTALFGTVSGDTFVIAAREESGQEVESRARVGYMIPVFYMSHGKAIAAFLPDDERQRLLAREGLSFEKGGAPVEREALRRELDECRRNGYALQMGKVNPMIKMLAAPVLGPTGSPIGSIFTIGVFRKSLITRYGAKVAEAGRKMSALLGGDVYWPAAGGGTSGIAQKGGEDEE